MNPSYTDIIAEWKEPHSNVENSSTHMFYLIILGGIVVAGILGFVGYNQKDFTFYLASVAAVVGGVALAMQRHRPTKGLPIVIHPTVLEVGVKEYPLELLAGFWLEHENEALIVNVEPKKSSLFPISFRYANDNSTEARQTFLQILPEVEPRPKSVTDDLNKILRL